MTAWLTAVVEGGRLTAPDERPVPWWSFTKTALAAASLVLVARGLLTLDATVDGEAFTLRDLLRHRSGLGDYGMLPAYHVAVARGDAPWPGDAIRVRVGPPAWAADTRFSYSNVGYMRVVALIEAATGTGLDDALADLVLAPLGIRRTRLAHSLADLDATAWGNAGGYDPGWVYHGLLIGPVGDAALLLDRLLRGGLLTPDLLAEMRAAVAVPDAQPARPWARAAYGLGLMSGLGRLSGGGPPMIEVEGHTGGGPGSRIAVYHARALDRTVCVAAAIEDEAEIERRAFVLAHTPDIAATHECGAVSGGNA